MHGNWPITHYSSGEVTKRFVNKQGEVVREEFAELPIKKSEKGREKGLTYGVRHAIFGTREELKRRGLSGLAEAIILFDGDAEAVKEYLNPRDVGSFIGNRKDENCEGK